MSIARVAILDCDPLVSSIRARYGDYGGVIAAFLNAGSKRLSLSQDLLELSTWKVTEENFHYPSLETTDALVITGSRFSAYDDVPWITALVEYVKRALGDARVRIVGLCFGHQIVGRALGAEGGPNKLGYEMSVRRVALTPVGKEIFGKEDLAVHQMHHDVLYSHPQGVAALGSSPVCEVQGMFGPRKLLTLQGHPEFDGSIMVALLEATDELGFNDRTLWDDAMEESKKPHDGELVASTIVRFIRGELDSLDAGTR